MQNVKTFHITSMDEIKTHYNEVLKDPTIEGYRCIGGACRKSYGYDPEKDTVLRKEGEFYFSNPSYKKKEESHEADLEDDDFDIPEDDIVEEVETKEEASDAMEQVEEVHEQKETAEIATKEEPAPVDESDNVEDLKKRIHELEQANKAKDEALDAASALIEKYKTFERTIFFAAKVVKDLFSEADSYPFSKK